jgi:transcriptional regulator with XRE-family HTH domain
MLETETTFGIWLRHQRRQLDLTQMELAARVGYSVVTIRKLERDELRPSKELAERLAQQLNVAVTHRASAVAFVRAPSSYPAPADALPGQSLAPSTLIPQLTPFVGRATELWEVAHLLTDPACRLLTLVGLGGIGKTRLAIEVAQTLV